MVIFESPTSNALFRGDVERAESGKLVPTPDARFDATQTPGGPASGQQFSLSDVDVSIPRVAGVPTAADVERTATRLALLVAGFVLILVTVNAVGRGVGRGLAS